ncbi:monocarboxylate transporter 2 [Helicoverpa armigera]|uniref:monocarboxylate transporter 2 n=1 Tax=Helicoverpa armigera TaxID=29058 RepID=UPI003082EB22
MPPKAGAAKPTGIKKSIIVPSKVYTKDSSSTIKPEDIEGVEETEITAQISVPTEGGWGWVVVAASFLTIFLLDGVYFTFGSIYHDMCDDLKVGESVVALVNSVAVAVYFMGGPLVSALINRFGFRAVCMTGSIISASALLCTYFVVDFVTILILYGLFGGFGACLCSMGSGLVVGFYFEKLRSLAMAISSIGSSIGIMIMFTVNSYIVKLAGWRLLVLMQSGLVGLIYFLAMTFRPLLSLTVTTVVDEPTRTVAYLPSCHKSSTIKDKKGSDAKCCRTAVQRCIKCTLSYCGSDWREYSANADASGSFYSSCIKAYSYRSRSSKWNQSKTIETSSVFNIQVEI